MRKLIFAINTTLDGCVDHTKVIGTEETLEYFTHRMRDVDLQVFGRKTYQLMVPFGLKSQKTSQWTVSVPGSSRASVIHSVAAVALAIAIVGVAGVSRATDGQAGSNPKVRLADYPGVAA